MCRKDDKRMNAKFKLLPAHILIALCLFTFVRGERYFVDALNGSDENTGTVADSAWQTLTKINTTTFAPGDTILFRSNGVWTGRLAPRGSGTEGKPILIDRYDTGNKPLIDGAGITGGVVYLNNQEYWEISSLEITNDAETESDRVGVRILASNFGTVDHIYLRDLYIHNIKGIVGGTIAAKNCGGINIRVDSDGSVATRYNDILIENCVIESCNGSGISNIANTDDYPGTGRWHERKFTNYIIRGNSISDISKNAVIMRMSDSTCVVEYNVCWNTANRAGSGNTIFSRSCLGTIFQFNEGFLNQSSESIDGSLYDADIKSPGCIFQYSYSHDNNHGLFWSISDLQDTGIIVRYNISQNDKGRIFRFTSGTGEHWIYNNTIYIPAHLSPTIIRESTSSEPARDFYYFNNIIYNLSPYAAYVFGGSHYNRIFENNCFYGRHPSNEPFDPKKITSDPMLEAVGSGGQGIDAVNGYRLKAGSPCIDKGRVVEGNGGRDYFGNKLYNGAPDIGAHEYYDPSGLGGASDGAIKNIIRTYTLTENYPNPFNPRTSVRFTLPDMAMVRIDVFNLQGQMIKTLLEDLKFSGEHETIWNGDDQSGQSVSSGIYVARMTARSQEQVHVSSLKMVLIR